MADQLSTFNLALGHLRERRVASLSENREPRRVLSDYWAQVVAECVEAGLWNFAVRAVQVDASTTLQPQFGYNYAMAIPADWVRTVTVSSDQTFNYPLDDYTEETGYWFTNWTPIFIKYVSKDPAYGMNLGAWPASFTKFVALELASQTCGRVTGSTDLLSGTEGITRWLRLAKAHSLSKDAMDEPPGQPPTGTWARSRRGFMQGMVGPNDDIGGDLSPPPTN